MLSPSGVESCTVQAETLPIPDESCPFLPVVRAWGRLCSVHPLLKSFDITDDQITIGRDQTRTICVPNLTVSGFHCRISRQLEETQGNNIYLEDFSTNGTFVNKVKVGKGNHHLLADGDSISLTNPMAPKDPRFPKLLNLLLVTSIRVLFVSLSVCVDPLMYFFRLLLPIHPDQFAGALDDCFSSKYVPQHSLGTGAFGEVRRAIQKSTGREFAVKIVDKKKYWKMLAMFWKVPHPIQSSDALQHRDRASTEKDGDRPAVSPYLAEYAIMSCVSDHPNIVSVEEAFEGDKKCYLVME
jgi:hypothetical protein